jgi:hypothetical protein
VPLLRFRPAARAVVLAAAVSYACSRTRLPADDSLALAVAAAFALVVLYVAVGIAMGAIHRRDLDLIRSVVRGAVPEPR